MERKFGRLPSHDVNDYRYPAATLLKLVYRDAITKRYWQDDLWWGDQGETNQCVGYAWVHWAEDGPVTHEDSRVTPPIVAPATVYGIAQKNDEWPGEGYEGTSVRGGAKAMQELGLCAEYRWADNADTVADVVLHVGPMVVGSVWTEGMMEPEWETGFLYPSGEVLGGHAYLVNGYDATTQEFRIKNSWGRSWGIDGYAYIHKDDLDWLLKQDGEACIATEIKIGPTPVPVDVSSSKTGCLGSIIKWIREIFT